ncbi:MAG TPA: hypothetical protein VM582_08575 [Candidatus Thermoplasmatota archaeon]|nr:hypothetical protein [Candidatus Thermoplasmatota archaeon]
MRAFGPGRRGPVAALALLLAIGILSAAMAFYVAPSDRQLGPERALTRADAALPASDGAFVLFLERAAPPGEACVRPALDGEPLPDICAAASSRLVSVELASGARRVLDEDSAAGPDGRLLDGGRYLLRPATLVDLATGARSTLPLPDGFRPELLSGSRILGASGGGVATFDVESGTLREHALQPRAGAASSAPVGLDGDVLAFQWVHGDGDVGARASLVDLRTGAWMDVDLGGRALAEPLSPDARTFALAHGRTYALARAPDGAMTLLVHDARSLALLAAIDLPERSTLVESLSVGDSTWVVAYQGERGAQLAWGDLDGQAAHAPRDRVERARAVAAGAQVAYERGSPGEGIFVATPGAKPAAPLLWAGLSGAALLALLPVGLLGRRARDERDTRRR